MNTHKANAERRSNNETPVVAHNMPVSVEGAGVEMGVGVVVGLGVLVISAVVLFGFSTLTNCTTLVTLSTVYSSPSSTREGVAGAVTGTLMLTFTTMHDIGIQWQRNRKINSSMIAVFCQISFYHK